MSMTFNVIITAEEQFRPVMGHPGRLVVEKAISPLMTTAALSSHDFRLCSSPRRMLRETSMSRQRVIRLDL
jgi:hypothetical protein